MLDCILASSAGLGEPFCEQFEYCSSGIGWLKAQRSATSSSPALEASMQYTGRFAS